MIRFKKLSFLYIATLMQIYLVEGQRNGGYIDYGSYYVPHTQSGTGTVQYVPVQGPVNVKSPTYSTANPQASNEHSLNSPYSPNGHYISNGQYTSYELHSPYEPHSLYEPYPPNGPQSPYGAHSSYGSHPPYGPYPPNGPHPHFNAPYSHSPTVPLQGVEQAHALSSAYPNQPVIVINNGGNGDTGGNSNNGNNNGKGSGGGGLFGDNFNFGDLAAIFLASNHHKGRGGPVGGPGGVPGPQGEADIPGPPVPIAAPVSASAVPQGNNNFGNNAETGCSNKGSNISITIILPSSGGSVTVKDKKKKRKNKNKKSKKKSKDKEEEDETINTSDGEDDNGDHQGDSEIDDDDN